MDPTALFGTIHRLHCTISVNFYFYLQYFQQKVFSFNKISGSQTNMMEKKMKRTKKMMKIKKEKKGEYKREGAR